MSQNQWGWFLCVAGALAVAATLVGDVLTLYRSGGSVDYLFIQGMGLHIGGVAAAIKGGVMILPKSFSVSDEKRAELAQKVSV